ncbi:MAG: hypothetical protein AAB521_03435 [Patescibacteria group bacterium]|mgnify:CR=1 FL=1
MSSFKEAPNESRNALAREVLKTLTTSPDLIKDSGLKHIGQEAGLHAYQQLLGEVGVPPEVIAFTVGETARSLKERPRRDTTIFIQKMHGVSLSDPQA